jgi:hypothetical protein
MLPQTGQVLHFSEDPAIKRFSPHVAATAQQPEPYVWAVDAARAPSYWFPRQCPRAMAWARPSSTEQDKALILGPGGGERVHAVEYGWLEAIRTVELYAYRFDAADFRAFGDPAEPHAYVSELTVEPLGPPEPVGDLLSLHGKAGIQLRVLPNLWEFWDEVIGSTLGFSGIRMRNALPRAGD